MTANRYNPHLLILPEDDANRQVVNGFCSFFATRQIQILNEAHGWPGVCQVFEDEYVRYLRAYAKAYMALIVDFDEQSDRLERIRSVIPADLADRVFVLGAWKDPEDLRREGLGPFESIGEAMARDCAHASQGSGRTDC